MANTFRPRTLVLFLGDLLSFVLALWLSLYLRVFEAPSQATFFAHLAPFSLLFVAWVAVFFIAGLYENRSIILARRALSATLLITLAFNMGLAAIFFFLVPAFGIAPKTLLAIYLVASFALILPWRVFIFPRLQKPEPAIVVGEGVEIMELVDAMRAAHRAPVIVAEIVSPTGDLSRAIVEAMERQRARVVIADFTDARVSAAFPRVYNLLSVGVRFVDALTLYEDIFGRIPLSILNDQWVARNVSRSAHTLYDPVKRFMDILIALPLALLSAITYPFVMLAVKAEDRGDVFVLLPRVGENTKTISIRKFRSMTGNDAGDYGAAGSSKLAVTRTGKFLRKSRLDELPQLWSVVRGDLSLIGPRPETPALVAVYEKEIPYYNLRHLVKPGLSGWAQLYHDNHPHAVTDVTATREKLSYDLYYLKHRSLLLDLTIALKTIKKLLTRSGV